MSAGTPPATPGTYTYLRDLPADADQFGSHDRIARGMADAVLINPALGVIGLVGPWGSGKSTVVRFFERNLKDHKDIESYVFTYDAWLHQSDPPRRAFPEGFIHFLIDSKLGTEKSWKEELDRLNGRIEVTEITKTPLLTKEGASVFISLLLAPIGLSLLMKSTIESALKLEGFWPSLSTGIISLFGLAFLAAPLVVAGRIYLSWRPWKKVFSQKFWNKENLTEHRDEMKGKSVLAMFMSKDVTNHLNRITRDPIPTAIEFQNLLRTIMHEVGKPARRFVFVIDNLDRLPAEDALEMWATIRSFFLGKSSAGDPPLYELPTVVLPFDETALRNIYKDGVEESGEMSRTAAFMEKTFDLTFRVTRPVLTGWQDYVKSQMVHLFGTDLEDSWTRRTTDFLDAYFIPTGIPVTPRRINSILNTIAVTWRQWKMEDVSFVSVAYYCVFQRRIDDGLMMQIATPQASIDQHDANWQRSIAALHFGVPPKVAYQVLLEGPIRAALASEKKGELGKLMESPGFDPVFRRFVQQLQSPDSVATEGVVACINHLQDASPALKSHHAEEWALLQQAFIKTSRWNMFGEPLRSASLHLIERGELLEQKKKVLVSTLSHTIDAVTAAEASNAESLGVFFNEIDARFPDLVEGVDSLVIPNPPETLARVAELCSSHPQVLARLSTDAESGAIFGVLATDLNLLDAERTEARFRAVLQTRYGEQDRAYIDAVATRLGNPVGPGSETALLALGLAARAGNKAAIEHISQLVSSNRLLEIVNDAWTLDTLLIYARASVLLLLNNPGMFPSARPALKLPSPDQFSLLVTQALADFAGPERMTFGALLNIVHAASATRFVLHPTLARSIETGEVSDFTVDDHFAKFALLVSVFAEQESTALSRLMAEQASFWTAIAARPVDSVSVTLLRQLSADPTFAPQAFTTLASILGKVPEETWTAAIAGPNDATAAIELYKLHDLGRLELPALAVPLTRTMETTFASPSPEWLARWFFLAFLLPDANRRTLLKTLRDRILTVDPATPLQPVLTAGGPALIEDGRFVDKADDFIRRIYAVFKAQPEAETYLMTQAAALAPLFKGSSDDTRQVIGEWVNGLARSATATEVGLATVLGASWGIELAAEQQEKHLSEPDQDKGAPSF
ncbi:P-loop NTPase fold protein [Rhodanobacter glycinis]|uniref:P-loop NTPase fold protein n=1 Tax=Rhodanobacter glycinis TaxID=582702 RepID=UPI001375EF80|nr:P-loop NTPase fold protein [Rhodanobacter glycinis]